MSSTLFEQSRPPLEARGVGKRFLLHGQGGAVINVMQSLSFELHAGECVVLSGPSGVGKSTLLKMLYGDYCIGSGSIRLNFDDGALALEEIPAHFWPQLRREIIGYVSQFLRVVPRVSAVDIVMEPLLVRGEDEHSSRHAAESLLARLNLPERLWSLAPSTFSGGEQQRVNIARSFIAPYPILLLDEPTASLDAVNRSVVITLIDEAKRNGSAMLGVFHDEQVRDRVADRLLPLTND